MGEVPTIICTAQLELPLHTPGHPGVSLDWWSNVELKKRGLQGRYYKKNTALQEVL